MALGVATGPTRRRASPSVAAALHLGCHPIAKPPQSPAGSPAGRARSRAATTVKRCSCGRTPRPSTDEYRSPWAHCSQWLLRSESPRGATSGRDRKGGLMYQRVGASEGREPFPLWRRRCAPALPCAARAGPSRRSCAGRCWSCSCNETTDRVSISWAPVGRLCDTGVSPSQRSARPVPEVRSLVGSATWSAVAAPDGEPL